jgi:hypothetical protein
VRNKTRRKSVKLVSGEDYTKLRLTSPSSGVIYSTLDHPDRFATNVPAFLTMSRFWCVQRVAAEPPAAFLVDSLKPSR